MINIDWLQFSAKVNKGFAPNYTNDYSADFITETNLFEIVESVKYKGSEIAVLQRQPRKTNKFLKPENIIVKLVNSLLYTKDCNAFINKICKDLNLTWLHWGRIDISFDFTRFDNYQNTPEQFIRDFISGAILKKQRNATQFKVIGKSHNTTSKINKLNAGAIGNSIEYLKFGTYTSDISYYLYNKSIEFLEKGKKPHIIKAWKKHNIDMSENVWRLEFSIKNFNKALIYKAKRKESEIYQEHAEAGEVVSYFRERNFIEPKNIERVYSFLYYHYFFFVSNAPGLDSNISRRPRINLLNTFKYNSANLRLIDITRTKDETRSARIYLKKLDKSNNEIRAARRENEHKLLNNIMLKMIKENSVEKWALGNIASLPDWMQAELKERVKKLGFN